MERLQHIQIKEQDLNYDFTEVFINMLFLELFI